VPKYLTESNFKGLTTEWPTNSLWGLGARCLSMVNEIEDRSSFMFWYSLATPEANKKLISIHYIHI